MRPERIERALREVTREARIEPAPGIDWEAVEERLPMTRIATLPPRAPSVRPALLAAALSFGALLLCIGWWRGHTPDAPVANAPHLAATPRAPGSTEIDGSTLAPGARVTAGDVAQAVVHRGHATWTLAPGSAAILLTQGDVVAIRLETGSVTSRVVKSSRVETFAVEAADVRIAAHGTEFVVTLAPDGVSVHVTEGSVLVGPRDEPGVGQLLQSPAAGQFTLAGKPATPEENGGLAALRPRRAPAALPDEAQGPSMNSGSPERSAAQATEGSGPVASTSGPKVKPSAPVGAGSAAPDPSAEPTAPEQPTAAGIESATSDVIKLAAMCFKQRTATSDGVRVTAQTTITFRTLADGGVRSVVFEPPLSPWVQACITTGMGAIHTESTRYGFQVSRTVNLER
jgi:ferric-dicitrate binding protein FerR (iron transport regulator)